MKTAIHFYYISLSSSYNEECVKQNCRENQTIHFISHIPFKNSSANAAVR